jgi:hypothetical protein
VDEDIDLGMDVISVETQRTLGRPDVINNFLRVIRKRSVDPPLPVL